MSESQNRGSAPGLPPLTASASTDSNSTSGQEPLDCVVWFHAHTRVVIGKNEKLRFNLPEGRSVVLYDHVEVRNGVPVEHGITAAVTCKAQDITAARSLAALSLNWVVQIMSVASASAFQPPIFHLAWDVTPGTRKRKFVQRFPYSTGAGPRRMFRKGEFTQVWNAVDSADAPIRDNIGRALGWYRKAAIENNLLDKFVNLWSGLEALNQPLKDRHCLPQEKPIRECPKCSSAVAMSATDAGIEYAITTLVSADRSVFTDAIKARTGLMHGHLPLGKLSAIVGRVLPVLQDALAQSVMHLLGLDPARVSGALRGILMASDEHEVIVTASFHGEPPRVAGPEFEIPHLELLSLIEPKTQREGAETFDTFDAKLKPVGFAAGTKITCHVDILGPQDSNHPTPPPEVTITTGPATEVRTEPIQE